jgi:hypothetical protein
LHLKPFDFQSNALTVGANKAYWYKKLKRTVKYKEKTLFKQELKILKKKILKTKM